MGLVSGNTRFTERWLFALLALIVAIAARPVFAETAPAAPTPAPAPSEPARDPNATIPVGTLTHSYLPIQTMAPVDALYIRLFSGLDPKISQQYQDKWHYQEMQLPFDATEYRYEHLSLGTRDVLGRAPYEGDVRHDFAQAVLRQRVDAALREYFKGSDGALAVKRAENTVNQVKSMPIKMGSGDTPSEFHIGYDVLSDSSKFEYQKGIFFAGIYHPHLIAALTGQRPPNSNDLTMRVSGNFKAPFPTASLAYNPGNTVMEIALAKPLSKTIGTRIVSSTPLVAGAAVCQYTVQVTYQF
jgi:hypothetical protein